MLVPNQESQIAPTLRVHNESLPPANECIGDKTCSPMEVTNESEGGGSRLAARRINIDDWAHIHT